MKKKNLKAFTLAEILITLSIIGVVAALTIPTLIQRTGDEEIVSKLNKTYSTLSQATETIITERGGVKTWASDTKSIYEIYKEKLRISKSCGSASGCFKHKVQTLKAGEYAGGGSGIYFDTDASYYKMILSDGIQVMFDAGVDASCKRNYNGYTDGCTHIWVDVNGEKAPNTAGRDVFLFVLKETGLYPSGCDNENYCAAGTSGYGCACRVLQEGKIDY